jgi:hypothetical protein
MKLNKLGSAVYEPLECVVISEVSAGMLTVRDGQGNLYHHTPTTPEMQFAVGGSLGYHTLTVENDGLVVDRTTFRVDAATKLHDQAGFSGLMQMLYYTMIRDVERSAVKYNGRIYRYFVPWLRDHVHVMKGMKYFESYLRDGVDLYRDSQRADGMIWDNVYARTEHPNYWEVRFTEGDFIRIFDDHSAEFKRIPVENDVEYLFVEGLYYTWKATADDGWMAESLDAAVRAMNYPINNPWRWSEKYQLLKRGYTIDTWDFQAADDCTVAGDAMRIHPEKTHFGVMFGDNTGYAVGCDYLAEMLEHVGRGDEAAAFRQRGKEIRQRLDALSWNGEFFTHHVPEHPDRKRDLGVDEKTQVSLSNAYSLNRRISQEQASAIIRTYQRIRDNLPAGSPGEWYTIYPPFGKGYGGHNGMYQYMNASVTPIVAGELAHGAFERGYERYGADILKRLITLGERFGGQFYSSYTGAFPQRAPRNFTVIDLATYANADTSGKGADGVPGWTGEGDNDLHEMPVGAHYFAEIPFHVTDPAANNRRACIVLNTRSEYVQKVSVPVTAKAGSLYLLHAVSQTQPGGTAGLLSWEYTDGTSHSEYIVRGVNASGWWFPEAPRPYQDREIGAVAWRGKNSMSPDVGVVVVGFENPHPAREIARIHLSAAADGAFWMILGITLSDQPVYFPPNPISYGIPNSWSAAAVMYALVEGLIGVVDAGTGYKRVHFSPRWVAADVHHAAATIRYPACDGYTAYEYQHQHTQRTIDLTVTGSAEQVDVHLLLPPDIQEINTVTVNGQSVPFSIVSVENSVYVDFSLSGMGVQHVNVRY